MKMEKEIIQKYQFKQDLNLEFEILDLSEILKLKKSMMTVPHRAQFYHILWIEKGRGTHFIDFNPIELEDNCIIFVPSNSVGLFDKKGIYEGKTIIFTDNFFCKNKQDMQFLHSSILYSDLYEITKLKVLPKVSQMEVFLNAMQTEYNRTEDAAQCHILHNMLHVFLLQAEREMKSQGFEELKPSQNLDLLLTFKDKLEQDFHKEKSVKRYALKLNVSEKQLHKVTTSLLDKTPKLIIDERILLEAKRLLVHSSKSIKEIAYQLGFEEPTNFIKYFRKHTSNTPAEFREQY